MQTIEELLTSYASYHRDPRNKATHFIGVPLIVYALFIPLGWFRFRYPELLPVPLTAATVFCAAIFVYYLYLDSLIALLQAPILLVLLYLADKTSLLDLAPSASIFAAAFIGGWMIQFIGHYFEGKRPALFDNILQIFNAPLFLAMEVAFVLGLRSDLKAKIEQALAPG